MKLLLIDAYALIYRSYYGLIKNPRINSKGMNTSAIFGFVNTLEDVIRRIDPTHIAIGFDPPGPTFRHEVFPDYKAQREMTPEVIRSSVPVIRRIIAAYRIPILEVVRYEADDVIGTIARQAAEEGFEVYMMTPDKDYCQLVSDRILLYRPKFGGDYEQLGVSEVLKKYKLGSVGQMVDLLGLMGDASDNIPGCPGVGEVTAQKLLAEYGDIETLLLSTESLRGSLKDKIVENAEKIRFSKFLATIDVDVPVRFEAEACLRQKPDVQGLTELYTELEFRAFLKRLGTDKMTATASTDGTLDLFGDETAKSAKSAGSEISSNGMADLFGDTMPAQRGVPQQLSLFDKDLPASPEIDSALEKASPEIITKPELCSSRQSQPPISSPLSTIDSIPHAYYIADDDNKIAALLHILNDKKSFAFDTETDALDPISAHLVGMSFAVREFEAWYVPVPEDMDEAKALAARFAEILQDEEIEKVGQNIKFDMLVLRKYGVKMRGRLFDTMIAHYLLNPELRHGMDYLAETCLHYKPVPIEALTGSKGKAQLTMREVEVSKVAGYAAEDADVTLRLKNYFAPLLAGMSVESLFYDIEMPLVYVLAEMEYVGVSLDTDALSHYSDVLTEKMHLLEREIYEMAGTEFNLNSTRQVGEILFTRLQIAPANLKKTKTGGVSTGEDVLQKLRSRHPIVGRLLDYRGVKKLLSTYIDALPLLINPLTGKIHTSFNQTTTSTGRLSSTNPNLQNIPVRNDQGREIRKAFTADNAGCIFFSADYSQIELRVMAHISGDADMIAAFRRGADIHAATAARIFSVAEADVTPEMRRKAKTANFGIIYGISAFGLAERLDIPRSEARALIDGYFRTYPRVREFMDECIQSAREKGYVETLYRRRRYLADIHSNNTVVRGYAERTAINAPIQGSAADVIKVAMVRIHRRFEAESVRSKMILQVHDELNFNVLTEEFDLVRRIVLEEMEGAIRLSVPLIADCGQGSNWLEAH
ncbi:MAG: DNA polymerase I [Tannerella sp.]|jgi:DNA polymerase-1|nr:DNA polymerase I [Tannerella sp.]